MKPSLIIYRLFTFILLPIAGLNALSLFGLITIAIANPTLLIGVFVQFAIVAYTFTSFIFFTKGVQNNQPLKPQLKDWIKVNAYVAILYVAVIILCAAVYFGSAEVQKMVAANLDKMQATAGLKYNSTQELINTLKKAIIFAAGYAALLITHIIITFRLIKKNAHLFKAGAGNSVEN